MKYTLSHKLSKAFISILASIQVQMECAGITIYHQHSRAYTHDYTQSWQLLDVELTGMACSKQSAFATKGYFPRRYRHGQKLGRVLASNYQEVVVDQLFNGNSSLHTALQPLITTAEQLLELKPSKRARTIVRFKAGVGSVADINWLLAQGYQLHAEDYAGQPAQELALNVRRWVKDPRMSGRQIGWVTESADSYVLPGYRIAVRGPEKNGQWEDATIISTLAVRDVLTLTGQSPEHVMDDTAVLLAYVYFCDAYGSGVETASKEDKQGVEVTKRNKKRSGAQQMVMLLNELGHNVLI